MTISTADAYDKLTTFWRALGNYPTFAKHAQNDWWCALHPEDRKAFEGLSESDRKSLREWVYPGYWPNVPQHFKGDPRSARFVSVLMNPGRDDELQALSRDVSDDHALLSQQTDILDSLQNQDTFWWNWLDRHTLQKDARGLGLDRDALQNEKLYFEIELVPYQSPNFSKDLGPLHDAEKGFDYRELRSAELGLDLLRAMMQEAVSGEANRLFFIRGKHARELLLEDKQFKDITLNLIERKQIFTFYYQSRSLSADNPRLLGPSLGAVWRGYDSQLVAELQEPKD